MAYNAIKIFRDNIWKMTPPDPPLTYGIFYMFLKASLRHTFAWNVSLGTVLKKYGYNSLLLKTTAVDK